MSVLIDTRSSRASVSAGRPSQRITALRKDGKLDEAYQLALDLIAAGDADQWVRDAYGWCLIDLVKRHASDRETSLRDRYFGELALFPVPEGNALLAEHKERALALTDENRRAVMEAKKLGKEGRHAQAILAFATLQAAGKLRDEDRPSFGWELFHTIKSVLQASGKADLPLAAVNTTRRHLNSYLKLELPGPSLLHSCMLQYAHRLSLSEHVRLVAFARQWGLDRFRPEDYEESTAEDGKVFPSLVELVIQRASKEAAEGERPDEMLFILPYVERALGRFPANVWLQLNMAKLLRGLGRVEDARQLAIEFARKKAGEYWAWEFLGDLEADPAIRLSCYAKALSCSEEDAFLSKVRLKFASLLAAEHPAQARSEIERVIRYKQQAGNRIPAEADQLVQSAWFRQVEAAPTGRSFYDRLKAPAEEVLFHSLPWIDASLGDEFVIERPDGQRPRKRRRIFVKAPDYPIEISVAASHAGVLDKPIGQPISLQMEVSSEEPWRFTVYRIRARENGVADDVFPETCGVVDHVNHGKSLMHFIVAKGVDGTWPLKDFPMVAPGDAISVRMSRHHSRSGQRFRTLSIAPSTGIPDKDVCKPFREQVDVRNGLGFTASGIFIPPDLIASAGISDGGQVEGLAAVSFDRKRRVWGWKAIKAISIAG